MSYGGRSRYQYNFQPSPWESGRAPDRGMTGMNSMDAASQLAAANAILNAVLQGNDDRGMKRRFDSIDSSYGYNRRPSSFSSYRRGTQRYSGSTGNRGRGSASSRPRGRFQKTEDKDKPSEKKAKTEEKKEGDADEEKEDENAEEKEDKKNEKEGQDWKFRCHLCRKSYEAEEEHLEHLKTDDHAKTMSEQKSRYKRQMQAIVFKLRDLEEDSERRGNVSRHGFCTICNVGFYGPAARHNQNRLHKDMRNLKAAFCRYCNLRFVDRIKFDEHILTIRHMKRRTKAMTEGEDTLAEDKEEEVDDDEDGEDLYYPEIYNGEETIGKQCVNKIFGFFCKICCQFFTGGQNDKENHCKTEEHFSKFVEHAKVRKEEIKHKKEKLKREEEEKAAKAKENGEAEEEEADAMEEEAAIEEKEDEEADDNVDEEAHLNDDLVDDQVNEEAEDEEVKEEEEQEEVEEEKEAEEEEKEVPVLKGRARRGRGRGRGKKTSK